MAETIKRIAGVDLSPTANTSLYTVPASTSAIISITICNRTADDIVYRIAHTASGSAPSAGDYKTYNLTIVGNDTHQITGVSMSAGNQIIGYASATGLSITIDGIEVT